MAATIPPEPTTPRNAWPRVVGWVAIVALLVGGAVFVAREVIHAPAELVGKTSDLFGQGGAQLRSVAEAFQRGSVRTEFLSRAVELTGTSRFQFATLKQAEMFQREETGSTAWGWIPLPKVVVQAQAPVEYSYFLDFDAPWQFRREGDTVVVTPPPITAATPAIDVSALNFYTLEGSLWRDDKAVRERLRASLTEALRQRAGDNIPLVREVGRQRLTEFVTKWLADRYADGPHFHVKVQWEAADAVVLEQPPQ